jgi:flavin reductase (DIM6/NTAB) family NADH-FMN oxidoreductase RutF
MAKKRLGPGTALYPVPVVMVTCVDKSGRANIVTVTWTGTVCSEPPMIGISVRPGRFSHPMIKDTGEFVANIPSADQLHALDYVGTISGRNCPDKFEAAGLTPLPAALVKAPLIKECPVNMECKVRQVLSLGTHDLFLGEVVAVHADEGVLREDDRLDPEKARAIAYVSGEYWSMGQRLGEHGLSKGKPVKHTERAV